MNTKLQSEARAEFTPLPWHLNSIKIEDTLSIIAHDPEFNADVRVADIPDCIDSESEENAAFIVRAVNAHEALTVALLQSQTIISDHVNGIERTAWPEVLSAIDAALRLASE